MYKVTDSQGFFLLFNKPFFFLNKKKPWKSVLGGQFKSFNHIQQDLTMYERCSQ